MPVRTLAVAALTSLILMPSAGAEELYGTLAKIADTGTIAIGHRETSVPFSFRNDEGEVEGYAIELCLEVADAVAAELGIDELAVEMVPVNPATRIPLLVDGTIDIECGSTTDNLSRQEQVDFSHITFITGTRLLVKADSGIEGIEDLDGKRIAVTSGTTNQAVIDAIAQESELEVELVPVADHGDGFELLERGEVDAYSTDHILLHGLISKADDPDAYAVVGRFLSYDPYALMVRRDDSAFRLVVNRTLSRLYRSGEIFTIYEKWFDPMGVPTNVLLEAAFAIQALPE
jgi:glutamate/aspartate transport system substrate-binding protein